MLCIINGILLDLWYWLNSNILVSWEKASISKRALKKCGLITNVDDSENQEVHIEKIPGYNMPLHDKEFNEE